MFGLQNNKNDNQDDQVMLKNVSKLATDLQSTNSKSAQDSGSAATPPTPDPTSTASSIPKAQPAVGFSSPQTTPIQDQPTASAVSDDQMPDPSVEEAPAEKVEEPAPEPPSSFSFPTAPVSQQDVADEEDTTEEPVTEQVSQDVEVSNQVDTTVEEPVVEPTTEPEPEMPEPEPALETKDTASSEAEFEMPSATSATIPESGDPMSASSAPIDPAKLQDMKQQAMEQLDPLVDHLDQSPEETFRTTMMMIQANDNHLLLEKALEAAKNIEDDKLRAQAMLDIINEINYFSQSTSHDTSAS